MLFLHKSLKRSDDIMKSFRRFCKVDFKTIDGVVEVFNNDKYQGYVIKLFQVTTKIMIQLFGTLNSILNYLVLKKIIPDNPYKYVTNKPTPKKNKKELNYFRIDEAKYVLKCLDKFADIRLKTFINIIFSLGCRREEACDLRWKDVDFAKKKK